MLFYAFLLVLYLRDIAFIINSTLSNIYKEGNNPLGN